MALEAAASATRENERRGITPGRAYDLGVGDAVAAIHALTPPPAEPRFERLSNDERAVVPEGYAAPIDTRTTRELIAERTAPQPTSMSAEQIVAVLGDPLGCVEIEPAEPAGGTAEPADWTVSDTELARDILCYLGIGSDASLEPGDRRRDRIAAMICADRERRIVKPATRITALEAENAALREVVAAVAKHVEGMDLGGSEHDHVCYRVDLRTDLLRRARALLQGGADAG